MAPAAVAAVAAVAADADSHSRLPGARRHSSSPAAAQSAAAVAVLGRAHAQMGLLCGG